MWDQTVLCVEHDSKTCLLSINLSLNSELFVKIIHHSDWNIAVFWVFSWKFDQSWPERLVKSHQDTDHVCCELNLFEILFFTFLKFVVVDCVTVGCGNVGTCLLLILHDLIDINCLLYLDWYCCRQTILDNHSRQKHKIKHLIFICPFFAQNTIRLIMFPNNVNIRQICFFFQTLNLEFIAPFLSKVWLNTDFHLRLQV